MGRFTSLGNTFQHRLQIWLQRTARRLDRLEYALAWLVEGGWTTCPRCRPEAGRRIPVPAALCMRCHEGRLER